MPDRRTSRQCPHLEVRYNWRARVPLKSAPSSWGASGVWALHPIPVGLLGSLGPQRSAPKPLHDRLIRFCWVHRCAKQIGRHSDHGVCDMQAMAIGRMRIYAMHAMPLRRGPVGKICTVHTRCNISVPDSSKPPGVRHSTLHPFVCVRLYTIHIFAFVMSNWLTHAVI